MRLSDASCLVLRKKSHIVFFHINLLKWLLKLKGFHMLSYSDGIRVLRGKKKKKKKKKKSV